MFLDEQWSSNVDLHLYTDALDSRYGGLFHTAWITCAFSDTELCKSIYAIMVACNTWGHMLRRKRVLFYCDNISVVNIIQNGTSKSSDIMHLVRMLFYVCASHNMECSSVHIAGIQDEAADAISRDQITRFRSLVPDADTTPTPPAKLQIYEHFELFKSTHFSYIHRNRWQPTEYNGTHDTYRGS